MPNSAPSASSGSPVERTSRYPPSSVGVWHTIEEQRLYLGSACKRTCWIKAKYRTNHTLFVGGYSGCVSPVGTRPQYVRPRTPLERAWWELSFGTKQRSVCLIVKELRPFPPGEFLKFVLHSDPHKKTQDRTTAQCWKHVFFAAYNPSFFRKFLTPLENFLTPHDALVLKGLRGDKSLLW